MSRSSFRILRHAPFLIVSLGLILLSCRAGSGSEAQRTAPATPSTPSLVYAVVTKDQPGYKLFRRSLDGDPQLLSSAEGALLYQLVASPDGTQYAGLRQAGNTYSLVVMGSTGTVVHELTSPGVAFSGAGPFYGWSRDGLRFALTQQLNSSLSIQLFDAKTWKPLPLDTLGDGPIAEQDWSPDGTELLALAGDELKQIVVVDLRTGVRRALPPESPDTKAMPVWSPDGQRFAYWQQDGDHSGLGAIFVMGRNETSPELLARATFPSKFLWSPDGESLALACTQDAAASKVDGNVGGTPSGEPVSHACMVDLRTKAVSVLSPDEIPDSNVSLSADGRFVAYLSGADAQSSLIVQELSTGKTQLIAEGVPWGGFSWLDTR